MLNAVVWMKRPLSLQSGHREPEVHTAAYSQELSSSGCSAMSAFESETGRHMFTSVLNGR